MNNNNRTLHLRHWLTLLVLWGAPPTACFAGPAVNSGDWQSADTHNTLHAQEQLQERFIGEFSGFAGSAENAQSLYSGLRNGSRITLSMPASNINRGTGTSVVQFTSLARPMGNGGAFISIALAKQQLVNYGISRPTPWQVQAALNGGAVMPGNGASQPVALKGVLAQRAEGLGWNVIAKTSGISLGKVLDVLRNPSMDVTAAARNNAYANVATVTRDSRHAVANGSSGTMRTSVIAPAQGNGLIAQ